MIEWSSGLYTDLQAGYSDCLFLPWHKQDFPFCWGNAERPRLQLQVVFAASRICAECWAQGMLEWQTLETKTLFLLFHTFICYTDKKGCILDYKCNTWLKYVINKPKYIVAIWKLPDT